MTTPGASRRSLAAQIRAGTPLVGLILKLNSPAMAELGGAVGFDFLIFDTEHGLSGGTELEHHLRAADAVGITALVRVSTLNRTEIARALDAGATGIVVPQVETREQSRLSVHLAHYPPLGVRGLATSTRAGRQGTVSGRTHIEAAAHETLVVVQIESATGVAAADEILDVDGVSAVWVGLSDLSLSLGHLGQPEHPVVAEAVTTVFAAAQKAQVPVFIIADDEHEAHKWLTAGAQCLLVNQLVIVMRSLTGIRAAHHAAQIEGKRRIDAH